MSNEQSIRDEIADAIFDACEGYYAMGMETAKGVAQTFLASPVIRRIQAEALREAAHDARNYGHEGCYDFGDLMARADRIERGETA